MKMNYEIGENKKDLVLDMTIVCIELAFVDSTCNLDELRLRLYLLCTHSSAGGLPLVIFITSDQTSHHNNGSNLFWVPGKIVKTR